MRIWWRGKFPIKAGAQGVFISSIVVRAKARKTAAASYRGQFLESREKKVLELLDTSGARLDALLARLTLCEQTAGDLMQELFIRLCNSKGLDNAADPFAYAWRVATNLAFQWRRTQKIKLQTLDQESPPAQNCPSVLEKMIQAEELEQVLDATSQLSDLARDVVVMRYIEQASYEQIAQRLGKKPQHMRSVCAKALAQLRKLLVDQEKKSCLDKTG